MIAPGSAGEANSDWVMSPIPWLLLSDIGLGWLSRGTMVREMMFQSGPRGIGMTGCMLSMSCARLNGPVLKLVLFWNGRLIMLAMGFWAAFARASGSFDSPDEVAAVVAAIRLPNW